MTTPIIKDYIFYKIFCLNDAIELSYIGSTADWKQRNRSHKSDCNNENGKSYNTKVYKTIRENGGWGNFKMIEIGNKEQITLRQAEQIEEQYRVELNANMNGRSCFTTEEERIQIKKDYMKDWRENNPDYYKKYNQTESRKASQKKYAQTDEARASQKARNKKWRDKKKLEKENNKKTLL